MRKPLRDSAISSPLRSPYRRLFVAIGAVASVLVALVLAVERWFGLDMHAEYATLADAVADGAVTRGWVPEWVPASARELQESHDLDTNESWLTFTFDAADADFPNAPRRGTGEPIRTQQIPPASEDARTDVGREPAKTGLHPSEPACEPMPPDTVELPRAGPTRWWPKNFHGSSTPPADYAYYRCTWRRGGGETLHHYLAIDADARRAWVWGNH